MHHVMTSGRDRDVDIELRLRTSLLHVAQILRAAVAACGATGAGAARGAATKAVKSAPYSMLVDAVLVSGDPESPDTRLRIWPLQRSTAPVKKRERAILSS